MSHDKITIIAESFEAAALEFHRGKLSSKGYRMDGKITAQKFEFMDGAERKDLFDGKPMYSVSYIKDSLYFIDFLKKILSNILILNLRINIFGK